MLTTIILAGGKSSRMGFDKGLAEINSAKMIEHVLAVAKKVSDTVIIVSNNNAYDYLGLPVHEDIIKDCGPIGGIYTGLTYSKTAYNFVVACDMPFVSDTLVGKLQEYINQYNAVVPFVNNHLEPLCALYNKSINKDLKQAIDNKEYSVHKVLQKLSCKQVSFPSDTKYFGNINSPDDLKNIL